MSIPIQFLMRQLPSLCLFKGPYYGKLQKCKKRSQQMIISRIHLCHYWLESNLTNQQTVFTGSNTNSIIQ